MRAPPKHASILLWPEKTGVGIYSKGICSLILGFYNPDTQRSKVQLSRLGGFYDI